MPGNVNITIADNVGSSVIVPASSVVALGGCSSAGTVGQVVGTRSIATLISTFGDGPLVQLGALLILCGATLLASRTTSAGVGTQSAVTFVGTGTSVVTVTGAARDTCFVKLKVITSGTIAAAGITFQLSFDAGRTYGPVIALGTANTYAIPNLGVTINFGAGTLVANDAATFSTVEPTWNAAGVTSWLAAMQASPYAQTGWGRTVLAGDLTGANATTFQGNLDSMAAGYLFAHMICNARDTIKPVAWGGAGETDATWVTAVQTDYAAVTARRILASAGHYNMPAAIANSAAGAPRYRRPLSWAIAGRKVQSQPQVLSSRVRDGALGTIVVDPTNDPSDGFNYHDERMNPGLDTTRFASAMTRIGKGSGYFVASENLMSPIGSQFPLLALGDVMDIACAIAYPVALDIVDDSIRLNANGTIYENDAKRIEQTIAGAINDGTMGMVSGGCLVTIDRTNNIVATQAVSISITIYQLGYARTVNITIQLNNPNAAAVA